jgi:hypothetical protein
LAAGGPAPRPSDLSPSVFVAIIRVSCAGKIDFAMYRTDFFLCLFAVSMMLYRRLPKHRRPSSELPEVTHRVYLDIRECCLSPFACVLFVCLIVVGPPLTRHIVPLSHIPRVRHVLLIVLAKTKYDGWRVRIISGPAIRSIIEISPPHTSRTNTVIADEDEPIRGRIALGLFGNIAPRTVENFRSLCACDGGDGKVSGRPLCYAGTKFHRIGEWYGGGWVG